MNNYSLSLLQVHASDPEGDSGITYSIVDGSFGQFTINPTTGLISTSALLDREVRGTYVLRVQATDTGGSPLSGFTQVRYVLCYRHLEYADFITAWTVCCG